MFVTENLDNRECLPKDVISPGSWVLLSESDTMQGQLPHKHIDASISGSKVISLGM